MLHDAVVLACGLDHLRPSTTLWLHGFSTYTSLPAWHAQMANSECQWLQVAIDTASRFLSSRALRMSCTHLGLCPDFLSTDVARGKNNRLSGSTR